MDSTQDSMNGLDRALPWADIQERLLTCMAHSDETGIADGVDLILSQGAWHGCSDIHFEAWMEHYAIRYRIDGILHQVALLPRRYQSKLNARIKVLSNLVVYRKDTPQDGRIDQDKTRCGRPMRVSTVPTIKGEKLVVRLLGDSQDAFTLNALGFQLAVTVRIESLLTRCQGTLLLTGPSSSGKTTTIYALLRELMAQRADATNIVTIEDPVESSMDKITQIQVNPHVDFTFANALRAILRQDPEVIMVGEIRDVETANMAIQAGLTGHFVISTIHSGTAAGVFTRLLDMGIEPFLVASSLTGVLAQRLVRRICPHCRETCEASPLLLQLFGSVKPEDCFYHGVGCDACNGIGYLGRTGIGELLLVNQTIAEFVLRRPTTAQLHRLAMEQAMEPLVEDGFRKAKNGETTLEELLRVVPDIAI